MNNSLKIFLVNFIYLLPATVSCVMYCNSFFQFFEIPSLNILPNLLENVLRIIFTESFIIFYLMALTFTILLYPLFQILLFCVNIKKNFVQKRYIIIMFIWSSAIAFTYLYLIFAKGYILTA